MEIIIELSMTTYDQILINSKLQDRKSIKSFVAASKVFQEQYTVTNTCYE